VPVIDLSRWLKMYLMLEDVKHLTEQVSASLTHLQNAAATLGGGNLVDDILIGQRYLTADLHSISYSIDTVTTQFETVFPSQQAAADIAPSDVEALRSNWDGEIQESGLAAARAQSALSRIETNTQSAIAVLERSQATTGGTSDEGSQLAKLQALVQMLGIINSDLTTLATTLAASERVNADVAASEASDQDLETAKAERMLRDFAAPQTIPEIDPRLLPDGTSPP
jgi:conjugal transfer/entry exclusion protein